MNSFFCFLIFSCGGGDEPNVTPRAELEYGHVLYSYYQDDIDQAQLDVSVDLENGVPDEFVTRYQLAEGSFAFQNRMFSFARERFAAVEAQELTELDRMRLSFHLSREHFRTGDWNQLDKQLAKIDLGVKRFSGRPRFHPEVEYMRAEHALQSDDLEAAETYLDRVPDSQALKMYGLFNLGSAQREAGSSEQALQTFSDVAAIPPKNEEMLDLQQRAILARAFMQRESGDIAQAEQLLGRLPAEGRYRDLALASFGSLAMEQGDYELAARVWLTLQKDAIWTPSTATAQLGFPLSLENMNRRDLALTHYRTAEASFESRAQKLRSLTRLAADPAWVGELLEVFASDETDPERMSDWQERLGHTDWLQWLSTESVDSLLVQWRELRESQRWLANLPEHLSSLEELTTEQNRRATAVRERLVDDGLLSRHQQIDAKTEERQRQWQELSQRAVEPSIEWMNQFANDAERKKLERLQGMYEFVQAKSAAGLLDTESVGQWLQRLDRLRGMIFWELAEQRPIRLQNIRRSIRRVEEFSQQMLAQTSRLQAAQGDVTEGVVADYARLRGRSEQLVAKIDSALYAREQQIAAELQQGIRRESKQVDQYLLTARVAIARALDQYAGLSEQEIP